MWKAAINIFPGLFPVFLFCLGFDELVLQMHTEGKFGAGNDVLIVGANGRERWPSKVGRPFLVCVCVCVSGHAVFYFPLLFDDVK